MKCPQLSKLEAIAARNPNSISDRMEKKTLGETRLSRVSSPLTRRTSSLFQLQQSQIVELVDNSAANDVLDIFTDLNMFA